MEELPAANLCKVISTIFGVEAGTNNSNGSNNEANNKIAKLSPPMMKFSFQNQSIEFRKDSVHSIMFAMLLCNNSIVKHLRSFPSISNASFICPYSLYHQLRLQLQALCNAKTFRSAFSRIELDFDSDIILCRSGDFDQATLVVGDTKEEDRGKYSPESKRYKRDDNDCSESASNVSIVVIDMAHRVGDSAVNNESLSNGQFIRDGIYVKSLILNAEVYLWELLRPKLCEILHCQRLSLSSSLFRATVGHVSHLIAPEYRLVISADIDLDENRITSQSMDWNPIASWLAASPIVGPAVLLDAHIYRLHDVSSLDAHAVLLSSLPSALWLNSVSRRDLLGIEVSASNGATNPLMDVLCPVLPTTYVVEWWKYCNMKSLVTVMNEFLCRRQVIVKGSESALFGVIPLNDNHLNNYTELTAIPTEDKQQQIISKPDAPTAQLLQLSLPDKPHSLGTAANRVFRVVIEPPSMSSTSWISASGWNCESCMIGMRCCDCVGRASSVKEGEQIAALKALWAIEVAGRAQMMLGMDEKLHSRMQMPIISCHSLDRQAPAGNSTTAKSTVSSNNSIARQQSISVEKSMHITFSMEKISLDNYSSDDHISTSAALDSITEQTDKVMHCFLGIGVVPIEWELFFFTCEVNKSYVIQIVNDQLDNVSVHDIVVDRRLPPLNTIGNGLGFAPFKDIDNSNMCIDQLYKINIQSIESLSHLRRLQQQRTKASTALFSPSLSKQRIAYVSGIIARTGVRSWFDVGCGEARLFIAVLQDYLRAANIDITSSVRSTSIATADKAASSNLESIATTSRIGNKVLELGEDTSDDVEASFELSGATGAANGINSTNHPPFLERFIGIDLTEDNIRIATKFCNVYTQVLDNQSNQWSSTKEHALQQQPSKHCSALPLKSIELGILSLLDIPLWFAPDQLRAYRNLDLISCIEVIEHLPSVDIAIDIAANLLVYLSPKQLLISTPNYEANEHIARASDRSNSTNGQGDQLKGDTHHPQRYFREADHKFEFTRAEFVDYVNKVLKVAQDKYQLLLEGKLPQQHELRKYIQGLRRYEMQFEEVGLGLPGMELSGGATQFVLLTSVDNETDSANYSQKSSDTSAAASCKLEPYDPYWSWGKQFHHET